MISSKILLDPALYIPASALMAPIIAWLITRRRRRLQDVEAIVRAMRPGVLDQVSAFIGDSSFGNDAAFWEASGGVKGMLDRRHNAVLLLHLCQIKEREGFISGRDVSFIATRAMAIAFHCACSLPEGCIRWFAPTLPHGSARLVAELYVELETRVLLLCSTYAPDTERILAAVL